MNVKLAAQTLNRGYADEIEFLKADGDVNLRNRASTVKFIRNIE